MTQPSYRAAAATLLLLAITAGCSTLRAQTIPTLSRTLIVLDPAHGNSDPGALLSSSLTEKQFTAAFAARLRPLLTVAGFTVIATRDISTINPTSPSASTEAVPPITSDARAGTANHVHALACLILHASPRGSGVHLYTSTLAPVSDFVDRTAPVPWDTAQSAYVPLSLSLANLLGTTLLHASIPALLSRTATRPIDNLACPAVLLELAPLSAPTPTSLSDPTYQQHAAQAIVEALISWRTRNTPLAPSTSAFPLDPAAAPHTGASK